MNKKIELTDGILVLRAACCDDAPAMAAAVRESLIELQPWMDWASEAFDEVAAGRWLHFVELGWEHASAFHFAITEAKTGRFIGSCGLDGIDQKDGRCNLGYWIRTGCTRQGLASRAVKLAGRFAFETLELVRIEIVIAAGNLASQRAAQKAGAHYEGLHRNRLVVHTDVYDAIIYALARADLGLPIR